MAIWPNATQLAKEWSKREKLAVAGLRKIHQILVHESHADFYFFTSGKLKFEDREKLNWPYAREGTINDSKMRGARNVDFSGLSNPGAEFINFNARKRIQILPINRDTGELQRKIFLREIQDGVYHLGSDAPHASMVLGIGGLPRMVDRHFYGTRGIIKKRYLARRLGLKRAAQKVNAKTWK